jgi:hypothetical protein
MELHTEREEALYTTLQRVLQNHVSTHRLSYHETLAACISVLGYVLYVMLESWEEAPGLIASTTAELQQRVDTRASQGQRALAPFPSYATDTALSPRYFDLGTALATCCRGCPVAHGDAHVGRRRATRSLMRTPHGIGFSCLTHCYSHPTIAPPCSLYSFQRASLARESRPRRRVISTGLCTTREEKICHRP